MSCGLLGGQPSGETLTHEFWKRHQFVIGPDREANERHNIRELTARNVRFISAREHIDPSTPEGKFNATILTGSNQLQREQTARRTKDSLAQKVERGEPVSRLLPGYKRVKSVLPSGAVKTTIELEPAIGEVIRVRPAPAATVLVSSCRRMSARRHAAKACVATGSNIVIEDSDRPVPQRKRHASRKRGAKTDQYEVFKGLVESGIGEDFDRNLAQWRKAQQ